MSAFQFSDPGRCHDTEVVIWKTVFVQWLQELGWTEGRNLVIDYLAAWCGRSTAAVRYF
jgi:hypothetical protein